MTRGSIVDFGNGLQSFPNYYTIGPNVQWFHRHGVTGLFEEGPGANFGVGSDLEELKDWVAAEMMWDPSLDPDELISEFLVGYYGSASPFIRRSMDIMHAAVNQTQFFLRITVVADAWQSYLTPMALLSSAQAFADASRAPVSAVVQARVARAAQGNLYTALWRWEELRRFALANVSMAWPLPSTQAEAFRRFASVFNSTGTQLLTAMAPKPKGAEALRWLHGCVFAPYASDCGAARPPSFISRSTANQL